MLINRVNFMGCVIFRRVIYLYHLYKICKRYIIRKKKKKIRIYMKIRSPGIISRPKYNNVLFDFFQFLTYKIRLLQIFCHFLKIKTF